jgi:succinate dehydrogenase / fumarate reductase flavoprotein subunit
MLDQCGMSRTAGGLTETIDKIRTLRGEFWDDVRVPGEDTDLNQELEKAGRVADHFELAELMCRDALARNESCGGHFREEYQTEEGEALRDDENFRHVTVWEFQGAEKEPTAHQEQLEFEEVQLTQRSYK